MTLCRLELARVTASMMWPRAEAVARVYGYHVQALVTTKEHLENGPRDRRVNLEKWLKGNGEIADVLVSEKKGTAWSTWYLADGGRKQRGRSLCACPREVDGKSSSTDRHVWVDHEVSYQDTQGCAKLPRASRGATASRGLGKGFG